MRKKWSILTAAVLAISLAACSLDGSTEDADETSSEVQTEQTSEETDEDDAQEDLSEAVAGETYTGTVSAISEDSITVATDEGSVVIALSADTEFSYSMADGGSGDMGDIGDMEAMGDMAQEPGGDMESEGMQGDAPVSFDGAESATGNEGGEMPDGNDGNKEGTDMPSDESPAPGEDESNSPEKPGEEGADTFEMTDMPEGEDGDMPDLPEGEEGGMDENAPLGEGGMGGDPGAGGDMEQMQEIALTYEDIAVGDEVSVTVGDDGIASLVSVSMDMEGGMGGDPGAGGGMGGTNGVESYDAANIYTEDITVSDAELTSTGSDENTVLLETPDVTVTLNNVSITRESSDSTGGDNSSFYGVGASALATDGTLIIADSTITSNAAGGAGAFAYGDGTVYIYDTTITTEQDTSGGIHVAGGGTLYAWDLDVETQGESSAAIRSDRGSGTMVVDGGTYTSNWTGSPAVYSTADITVNGATLTANKSEAICIEGLNTIRLFDCDLTGNMQDLETNDCTWNVILYQSMSGDSEVGNSTFEMVGGTLTANNGGMFYTTNTESTFIISDVDITYSEDSAFLLKVTGNSNQRGWGTTGANGADCHFTAIDQVLEGDIIWDSISELDFYLMEGSTLTGTVINDETNAGNGGNGYANVYIESGSTWIVTGDSTLSALFCEGEIVDEDGNIVTIQGSDGTTYVSGSSAYTITVDSYSSEADFSEASSLDSFADFEVAKP